MIIFKDVLEQRRSLTVMKFFWLRLTVWCENFLSQKSFCANDGLFFIDSNQKTPEAEIKNIIFAEVRKGVAS